MENSSKYIKVAITILVIYLIFMGIYYFTSTRTIREAEAANYLLFGVDSMWIEKNGNWSDATTNEYNKAISDRRFQMYSNNQYLNTSKITQNGNTFNYIDSTGKSTVAYPSIMGYSSNDKTLQVANYKTTTLSSSDIVTINSRLPENVKITNADELAIGEKISFDFDNDGVEETLLLASTLYNYYISDSEYVFRIVLYIDGNNIQEVYNDVVLRSDTSTITYHVNTISIIRFNSSEKYSIIVNKFKPMGELVSCPTLLLFDDSNKLNEVKTCQEVVK